MPNVVSDESFRRHPELGRVLPLVRDPLAVAIAHVPSVSLETRVRSWRGAVGGGYRWRG
jgi:hypothetical protein